MLSELRDAGFEGGLALDIYRYEYHQVAGDAIAYLRGLMGNA